MYVLVCMYLMCYSKLRSALGMEFGIVLIKSCHLIISSFPDDMLTWQTCSVAQPWVIHCQQFAATKSTETRRKFNCT